MPFLTDTSHVGRWQPFHFWLRMTIYILWRWHLQRKRPRKGLSETSPASVQLLRAPHGRKARHWILEIFGEFTILVGNFARFKPQARFPSRKQQLRPRRLSTFSDKRLWRICCNKVLGQTCIKATKGCWDGNKLWSQNEKWQDCSNATKKCLSQNTFSSWP